MKSATPVSDGTVLAKPLGNRRKQVYLYKNEEAVEHRIAGHYVDWIGRVRGAGRDVHQADAFLLVGLHPLLGHPIRLGAVDSWYSL